MAASGEYLDYLCEVLAPLGPIGRKRMFGGAGLFYDGVMFALIADDELYLKVDDQIVSEFEELGASAFEYQAGNGKRAVMSYYSLPDEVLDDGDAIVRWGRKAVDAALRADLAKPKSKRKRRSG